MKTRTETLTNLLLVTKSVSGAKPDLEWGLLTQHVPTDASYGLAAE